VILGGANAHTMNLKCMMSNKELHNLRHNRGLCRWSKNGSIHWSVKCERVWWWRCIPVPLHVGLCAVAMWFRSFFFAIYLLSQFYIPTKITFHSHNSFFYSNSAHPLFTFSLYTNKIIIRWSLWITQVRMIQITIFSLIFWNSNVSIVINTC
jgi:hypothetical protein